MTAVGPNNEPLAKDSTKRVELINRYELFAEFLRNDFIPFSPVFDSGIDFILRRESDGLTLNVQQKAVWTVDKKYFGREIWMLFGDDYRDKRTKWFLIPHDYTVTFAKQRHGHTDSWSKRGWSTTLSRELKVAWKEFELSSVFASLQKTKIAELTNAFAKEW